MRRVQGAGVPVNNSFNKPNNYYSSLGNRSLSLEKKPDQALEPLPVAQNAIESNQSRERAYDDESSLLDSLRGLKNPLISTNEENNGDTSSKSLSSSRRRRRRKKKKNRKKNNKNRSKPVNTTKLSEKNISKVETDSIHELQENSTSSLAEENRIKNFLSDAFFFTEEQKILFREILDTWQLGAGISLVDLIGLDIDSCFEELIKKAQKITEPISQSIEEFFRSNKTIFEQRYSLFYISVIFEKEVLTKNPTLDTYLDNKFLYSINETKKLFETQKTEFSEYVESIFNILYEVFSQYPGKSKIKEAKTKPFNELKTQIEAIQKRYNLFLSILDSKDCFILLSSKSIANLFGLKACHARSPEEAFSHFKKLAQFQKDLLISASNIKKLFKTFPEFEKFVEDMPEKISEKSLYKFFQNCSETGRALQEHRYTHIHELDLVCNGTLTHTALCQQNRSLESIINSQDDVISFYFAKTMSITLAIRFAEDLRVIADEILMPLVSSNYKIKDTSCNRMILNFESFSAQPSVIEEKEFPLLVSNEKLNSTRAIFQKDFNKIAERFFKNLGPFKDDFIEIIKKNNEMLRYSPLLWMDLFNIISPMLEEVFPQMLSELEILNKDYTKQFKGLIEELPIEQRLGAFKELQKLLLNSSLLVCRIMLFCADLRALMDRYDLDELEEENFLLADKLFDLLEMQDLENKIQEGLSVSTEDSSTNSEEEKRVEIYTKKDEAIVVDTNETVFAQEEAQDLPLETSLASLSSRKNQQRSKEIETKEKDISKAKSLSKKAKGKKEESSEQIFIRRGMKRRKVLKQIKDKLKLTPEHMRGKGSHEFFKDPESNIGVTVPKTLKIGTAKSIQEQFNQMFPKQ